MDTFTIRQPKKRGRRDQGLHEQLHIQLTPAQKEWVMQQPEEAAALVRQLIEDERQRRVSSATREH